MNDLASDREFFAFVAKHPGMFVGRPNLDKVIGFLYGYHCAEKRIGPSIFDGLSLWLAENYDAPQNLIWSYQMHRIAHPGLEITVPLTEEQEKHSLATVFELIDKYLTDRESTTAVPASGDDQ